MPSSFHGHISDVVGIYLKANPKTVLDIGVGFGKWGMLFREYGDIFRGRLKPEEWKTSIFGVEIFPSYSNCIYKEIYTDVFFEDIRAFAQSMKTFDFIYAGDVIEHLPKDEALTLIKTLQKKSNQFVLSIPLGGKWPQGEVFGNVHETHLSVWEEKELSNLFSNKKIYTNPSGKSIGLFWS